MNAVLSTIHLRVREPVAPGPAKQSGRLLPALRRWIMNPAVLIDRNDLPKHLFGIPDLDLSEDLCTEPLVGPWFKLGASGTGSARDKQGVENVVYRQSMLLSPEDLAPYSISWSLLSATSANRADRLSAMAITGFIATLHSTDVKCLLHLRPPILLPFVPL